MEEFTEGMIVRIFCKDFLTYNETGVECYPCAKLNMIVGPNGTGKSSLVNAIVLGLGGKTSIIGRAKQLSAYVRRGCQKAKIEIELYSEPSNYVIGREFNIDNKTTWFINGQIVPFKEVEKIIKQMNIQVDNLCQFLPQDRVQDFSKMDSKQLLENTLKTVGSKEIVDLHENLKDLRNQETNLASKTKLLRQNLESEKKKISRLENEVKAIMERQEMMKKVAILEKKKAWLDVSEKEESKKRVQEDRKKILGIKKEAEESLAPFEREIERVKDNIKTVEREIQKEIKLSGDGMAAGRNILGVIEEGEDKMRSIENQLKDKLEAAKKRSEKISSLEEEIRNLETVIQPEKESRLQQQVSGMQPQLATKSEELLRAQRQAREVEQNISEVTRTKNRIEGALQREESAANKKLEVLKQRFPATYQAYQWLEDNRDKFRKHIYGPIMLEINCEQDAAKFVEFSIPHREMVMFVCEDKNDMNQLLKTVRDGMRLSINAAVVTRNYNSPASENYRPPLDLRSIKEFGFSDYIINKMEGPNAILNYLCANFALHQIPLGNKKTELMADKIPRQIRSYFSDSQHYLVRYSKYSGERSSRIVNVRDSFLLSGSTNTAAIAEYRRSIQKEHQKLEALMKNKDALMANISSIERVTNDLRQKKRDLDQELQKLKVGRTRLGMRKSELQKVIQQVEIDPEEEISKAKAEANKFVIALTSEPRKIIKYLKNTQSCFSKKLTNVQKKSHYQRILDGKKRDAAEARSKVDNANRMLENVEHELREVTRTWERAKAKAQEMSGGKTPTDAALRREFADLPDDLNGLEREISEATARVRCMGGGRESVLEEYDKTKKTIEDLERQVANPEKQLETIKERMENNRNQWIPQVQHLLERINANFSSFFCLINCVGEVSLEVPENQDEYSKYGISIQVQFRESSRLQKLGPHTQSGGEKAVATAIYMLSLQELTTVPFRCVDEINQGMDEHNERVVFKLMVNTVEKANSAQCFLLTPKILPNLEYSDNVRVLCIYSGPWSISRLRFKMNKYIERVARCSENTRRESLKRKHSQSDDSD
ncbi:structural maintenance of chromosomes protein 5-like [Macrosteles quadrilineatus]|uniref:structural maintenance of chromosomes protein 5-like n=1 Tax=Macrosteles quadrilineatus TaxID=74068 RepID=UPI0023E2E42D|nr:structural maintenance of chromosomes protein 5-like [Macrosteles quadrilineatus]